MGIDASRATVDDDAGRPPHADLPPEQHAAGSPTRAQFASVIKDAVINGESRTLSAGRTAYWSDGTVVIRDPHSADGGTTFRPADGHDYFLGLH